jgi:hypothetical protein
MGATERQPSGEAVRDSGHRRVEADRAESIEAKGVHNDANSFSSIY